MLRRKCCTIQLITLFILLFARVQPPSLLISCESTGFRAILLRAKKLLFSCHCCCHSPSGMGCYNNASGSLMLAIYQSRSYFVASLSEEQYRRNLCYNKLKAKKFLKWKFISKSKENEKLKIKNFNIEIQIRYCKMNIMQLQISP